MTLEFDSTQPLLVFGGPYSNLSATRAMRAEAERLGIPARQILCTGDVVAYAAEPEETARLIREWGIQVIAGNCEQQLAEAAPDCGCGFEEGSECDLLSRGWYPYALAQTSDMSRHWMATLPTSLSFRYCGLRCHMLHGGTEHTNRFIFASDDDAIQEELASLDADIVLAGHSGLPFVSRVDGRTWLNAGVIGIPANDGTPDVWYALLEPDGETLHLSLRRLAYDHIAAAAAMRRSGHANGYARAIITGIWPSHDVLPPAEREKTGKRLRQTKVSLQIQPVTT